MRNDFKQWKQYPKYKDSEIEWLGMIPESWEMKRLKWLFKIVNGSTPKSNVDKYWDGDIIWVTPDDLGNLINHKLITTDRKITEAGYLSCGTTLVSKGSLILSTRAPIGHLAIAGVNLCTNQGCKSLVFKNNGNSLYFYYLLSIAKSELKSWGQGSTFQELSKEDLSSINLLDISLTEQEKIAQFLDIETAKIDNLINKKQHLIKLLQEKRTAIISHAVTKGLNPDVPMKDSKVEWLGMIPESWNIFNLKRMAEINISNVDKKTELNQEQVLLCNYVDVYYNDYINNTLNFMEATATKEQQKRFELKKGDVLLTKDSETWDDIAIPACVETDLDNVLCGYHLAHIRPHPHKLYSKYLFRAISASGLKEQFWVAANGVTRFGLSKSSITNALFPIPPLDEQQKIAEYLDTETQQIDNLINKTRTSIEYLKEYRTALISAAVTGKIDVRDEVT